MSSGQIKTKKQTNKQTLTELDHKASCRCKTNVLHPLSSSWPWVLLANSGRASSLGSCAFVCSYQSAEVPIKDPSREGPFSSSVPFSVPPFAFVIKRLAYSPSGVLVEEPGFFPWLVSSIPFGVQLLHCGQFYPEYHQGPSYKWQAYEKKRSTSLRVQQRTRSHQFQIKESGSPHFENLRWL